MIGIRHRRFPLHRPLIQARIVTLRLLLPLALLLLALPALPPAAAQAAEAAAAPDNDPLRFRVRLTKMTPEQPVMIGWTYGGRGLGGKVVDGVITRELPATPAAPGEQAAVTDLMTQLEGGPKDRIVERDGTWDVHYLRPGVWSRPRPLKDLPSNMMTLQATGHETGAKMTDCEMEFELTYNGNVLKTFTIVADDFPNFGVIIPRKSLGEDGRPTPEFLAGLGSLRHHAEQKQELLRQEPWFNWPTPEILAVLSDCSSRHRTSDLQTMLGEVQVMAMMGMNGFRGVDAEVAQLVARGEGIGANFQKVRIGSGGVSFPIPMIDRGDGRAPFRHRGDGCPYLPENQANIPGIVQSGIQAMVQDAIDSGVEHFWGLTADEIGNVYGGANEGSNHPGSCQYCSEAFREMIRADGRTLEDFGASSWDAIRPVQGYWAINYWESHRILTEQVEAAKKALEDAARAPLGLDEPVATDFALEEKKPATDYAAQLVAARERLKELEWSSKILVVPEDERRLDLSQVGWNLLEYYSKQFLDRTSATLFAPQRKAVRALNDAKRKALAGDAENSSDAKRPWLYTYGLRQPRFIWGGGSIGWFDYYRHADTAMVYETSNRDSRVWQWESYMNDLGRSLQRYCDVDFGVYVKPHRGAPVQRAVSAALRGSTLLYWYTYGPEWSKGDSFGGSAQLRSTVAWGNRLIAAVEDVLVGAQWVRPAEVAIIRPRTDEFLSGAESWENGKWNYMALAHAHIPMDPLDETLVETADLSQYKVIVISGSHIRHSSATRLKQWVAQGGTLYTNGYGMAKDEAGRPLTLLHEVFGVNDRADAMPQWGATRRHGATTLAGITRTAEPPADAQVTAQDLLEGSFQPAVGCELLQPAPGATVLATDAAGRPVALRNQFGRGSAYLIGTFAGLEYASDVMDRRPYDAAKRSWISGPILAAGVEPVVKASHPLVEGVLVENPQSRRQVLGLMHWAWERPAPVLENVTITFRGFGDRRSVRSVALQQDLRATIDGEWMTVTLPKLADADMLVLE